MNLRMTTSPKNASLLNLQRICLILIISLFSVTGIYAQSAHEITGTVTSLGEPLAGASVIEAGTTNGTMTDLDGKFSLTVKDNAKIEISFIGFKPKTVTVGTETVFNIELEEEINLLNEVVAIGYGVQKKKLNTGATIQVKGDELAKMNTTNALQALQGKTPGVQITSTSGQPGESLKVRIRGLGTVADASPLFVVDGILTNDITYLNNSDIESIDVLKDAASAAIYGSQAANGVVLITTKTGKTGAKAQITFDAYYGVQQAARKAKLLNSQQYATIMNEAAINSGKSAYFTNDEIANMGTGTNWIDEMLVDDAITQNYSLGASGGSAASVWSMSLSYTGQEGIVGGKDLSNYERYNFRVNTEHNLYDNKVRLGQHLTFSYSKKNGIQVGNQYNNTLRAAFNTSPFVPMYDEDGNFWNNSNSDWYNGEANPYAQMVYNNQNKSNTQKLVGDVYLELEPIKNLKFRTTLGIDYFASESNSYKPIYRLSLYAFNDHTVATQSMNKGRTYNWDNLLSYNFKLNEDHDFGAMLGSSMSQYSGTWLNGSNVDLIFNSLNHAYLSNATNTLSNLLSLGGNKDADIKKLSYFGRLNYNYKETYLINATFRADGSSNFASGNRFGYFPSISTGWIMSNESFMEPAKNWMDYFKLRASWGQVGNQNVSAFQYLAMINQQNVNYIFGNTEGVLTPGANPDNLSNPGLSWETSEQFNLGFDARFLNGKMNVNFDWYNKKTKDWIISVPVLATAGVSSKYINGGDVTNKGVELGVSFSDNIGGLEYTIGANGAYNKNTVGQIPTEGGIINGLTNMLYDNATEFYRAQNGEPIGFFWGYKTAGIFQNEADVQNYKSNGKVLQPDAQPGDVKYVDVNGDGVIDTNDKGNVGDPNPDFTFGFNINLAYKNFDFALNASGMAGNDIVQSYRNIANRFSNYTTSVFDRWHGEGTSNSMPRVTEDGKNWSNFSDLYVHDGSFLRISNITLGYDFAKLIKSKYISSLRLYGQIQNLYTFTHYDGMDPEIGYGVDSFSSGIDLGYYPRPRTYLFGVNIKF